MVRRPLLVPALVIAALAAAAPQRAAAQQPTRVAPMTVDSLDAARRYTEWFLEGRIDSLHAHATPLAQAQFAGKLRLARAQAQFVRYAGPQVEVLDERWTPGAQLVRYDHVARFADAPEPVVLSWFLTRDGRIAHVGVALERDLRVLARR